METFVAKPKVTIGWRISLTKDFCEQMNIQIGDKVDLLFNEDAGDLVVRFKKATA